MSRTYRKANPLDLSDWRNLRAMGRKAPFIINGKYVADGTYNYDTIDVNKKLTSRVNMTKKQAAKIARKIARSECVEEINEFLYEEDYSNTEKEFDESMWDFIIYNQDRLRKIYDAEHKEQYRRIIAFCD